MYLNVKNGLAIIQMIKDEMIDKRDFIRTESYTLRLWPSRARKVTQSVNSWLNKTVEYEGKETAWNYVIFLKARDMVHYFIGKPRSFTFLTPKFPLNRQDSDEIRQKIVNISYVNWKKMGFSKGTLHYMKKNAKGNKPFTLNTRQGAVGSVG